MIRNYFKKTIFFSMMFFAFCCEMKKQKAIPKNLDDIKSSSLKVNKFFEKRFNDYVDRKPMFQTRLGIKKDYDKWNDISPIAEEKEIDEAKRSLDWLTDSVNINYLDQSTLLSYKLYKQRIENQISDYRYRLYNYLLIYYQFF